MVGNREYKSDVFGMLLEDPRYALEVYNALNDSGYQNPGMVEICTLERGISLSVRNDASFFLGMELNIYEHESTVCPNMPLRELIYVTNILEQWVRNQNIYGRKLVRIPRPRFVVFYNGLEDQPEQYELRLSEAFSNLTEEPELELKCKVYNINQGKNQKLLARCPVLGEYMAFVDYVRGFRKEYRELELGQIIEMAIDRCIEENILRDFLKRRRWEVAKMTQLDYTFERQLELEREEARAEERINTERERKAKEQERKAKEQERQRADLAEEENRRLRAELERYQKQG